MGGCVKEVYEGDPEPLVLVVLKMAPQRYNICLYILYAYATHIYRVQVEVEAGIISIVLSLSL